MFLYLCEIQKKNMTKSVHLSNGYVLYNRYFIREVLGKGGFGITYLAEMLDPEAYETNEFGNRIQLMNYKKIAIKEYFRDSICERDFNSNDIIISNSDKKKDFERMVENHIREAQTLHALEHPNIVKIIDTFKANNSAYSVMEYIDGNNLQRQIEEKGRLPLEDALRYILSICDAVSYIHNKKILHLDIKPNNIILSKNDRPVLIDFGASLIYKESGEIKDIDSTSEIVSGITKYYTCAEQNSYDTLKKWHPQFDAYALVATFYYLITGEKPPLTSDNDHNERLNVSKKYENLSDFHDSIFRKGLNQAFSERFKNVDELILALRNNHFIYGTAPKKSDPKDDTEMIEEKENFESNQQEGLEGTKVIEHKTPTSQEINKVKLALTNSKYKEALTLINQLKNKYGDKNASILSLENQYLKEKPKKLFQNYFLGTVFGVLLVLGSIIIMDKLKSKETIEQEISPVSESETAEDYLKRIMDTEVLSKFKRSHILENDLVMDEIIYKHNQRFDFIYSGQVVRTKKGQPIPDGIGKAFNQGIDPKTKIPYNSWIQGEFKNGLPNGYCKLTQEDGVIFKGNFKNGLPNGNGFYYKNEEESPLSVRCVDGTCSPN